jgi:uncharacterized protein with HEPN domain
MTTPRKYSEYLRDILDNARQAQQFVADIDFAAFERNTEKTYAVFYALEIIGEAARAIPSSMRARYPQVPWREITGMRDRLVHGYVNVDPFRVWETVQNDLPPLIATIKQMLADLGNDSPADKG